MIKLSHALMPVASMLLLTTLFTSVHAETTSSDASESDETISDEAAQPQVKWFRIAAKAGSPDFAGFQLEGIVPGIGEWLGIWTGFTYLPIGSSQSTTDGQVSETSSGGLTHFGIGANLYLPGEAKGLFASIGYDRVSAFHDVSSGTSNQTSWVNPTQMTSLQLGYRYVGRIFTFSFAGGYGFNFGYSRPDVADDDDILFRKGDWVLFNGSFGIALPFTRSPKRAHRRR